MHSTRSKLIIAFFLFLISVAEAAACSVCFSSVTRKVLGTYYISAIFLTLLPFGVMAGIVVYFRRFFSSQKEEPGK